MEDVLDVAPRGRLPWAPLAAGAGLVALLVGAVVVLPDGPPGPLVVRVLSLDGSALRGEAFVRLQLGVEAEGARELGEVRMSLAGSSSLGQSPGGLDDDGRATVQVDLVPPCPLDAAELGRGTLQLTVVDRDGASRQVEVPLPQGGPLERLVRYRCTT